MIQLRHHQDNFLQTHQIVSILLKGGGVNEEGERLIELKDKSVKSLKMEALKDETFA